ncbi:hypothetical protein GGF31_008638 [Allomyces arbusculus]|nr:hypothetical protein GGF31_008638 [Allomyces arbusculus]
MSSLSTPLLAPPSLGVSPATAVSPASSPMAASPVHSPSYLPAADAMQLDVHDDDVDAVMNDGAGADYDDEDALSAVMDDVFDDSDVEMGVTTPVARAEHPPAVAGHVSPLFRPHDAAHPLAPLMPAAHQQQSAATSSDSPVAQMPTPVSPLSAASVLADLVPPLAGAEVESFVSGTVAATVDSAVDADMNKHASTDLAEVPLSSLETDDAVEVAAPTDATAASLLPLQAPDSSVDSLAHADDKFDLSHSYSHLDDDEPEFVKLPSHDGGEDDEEHQECDGEGEEEEEELEAAALLKYDVHTYTLFGHQDTTAGTALFATTDLFYDEPINDLIRQLKAHFGLAQAEVALRFDNLEGLTIHEETDIAHSNHLVNFANLLRTLAPDSDTPLTMTLQVLGESAQWKLDQLVRRAQSLLEQDEDEYHQDDDEHGSLEHDETHFDDDEFALDASAETQSQPEQHQTEIVHDADDAQDAQQQPPASSESHPTTPTKAQISQAHTPTSTTTTLPPPARTSSATLLPASPTSVSPVPAADATVAHPTLTVDAVVANGHQSPVPTHQAHKDDDGLVAYEDAIADDHTSLGPAVPLSPTADHVFPARYGASRTVSPTLSPQQSGFSVAAASASAPMSPRMGAAAAVVPTRPRLIASPLLVGAALGAVAAATSGRGALFAPAQAEGAETEEIASETLSDAAPAAVSVVEDALNGSRKRGLELDDGSASSPKKPRLDGATTDVQGQ